MIGRRTDFMAGALSSIITTPNSAMCCSETISTLSSVSIGLIAIPALR